MGARVIRFPAERARPVDDERYVHPEHPEYSRKVARKLLEGSTPFPSQLCDQCPLGLNNGGDGRCGGCYPMDHYAQHHGGEFFRLLWSVRKGHR